jgi:uncharacterized protein (DUF302 family)
MSTKQDYGIRKTVALPYEQAVEKIRGALKENGFGVLTEIDMKAKLKEKLDADFKRYIILGACNPPLAYRALQAEPEIGLMLPCNVIVYEEGENQSVVSAADPRAMLGVVEGNEKLDAVAEETRKLLVKAVESM